MQVTHSSTAIATGVLPLDTQIADALAKTGALCLTGANRKYAGSMWLQAPVSTVATLTKADAIVAEVRGCKTLGDLLALRVAWVPKFGESAGLKLLHAQNALRPVLMTFGRPQA